MKQTVKYNGYTANTSDYVSKDGDLSASLNLINEDGGMKTIFEPSVVKDFSGFPYTKVVYLHRTASFSHIIMQKSNDYAVQWMNESDTPSAGTIHDISGATGVSIGMLHNVTSVGNTLVILSDTGLHYILWNGDVDGYKYIGQKPPFLSIRFSVSENQQCLRPEYDYGTDQSVVPTRTNNYVPYQATTYLRTDNGYNVFKNSAVQDAVTQAAWALVNNTNARITKDGHFYAPFFVRYCYRLFDGSTFMSSAPLFIPLSMPYTYQVFLSSLCKKTSGTQTMEILSNSQSNITIDGVSVSGDNIFITYLPSNVALTYKCTDSATLDTLKNDWGDIVKSIDIYVSGPIIRENDSEKITRVRETPFHYNAEYKSNVSSAEFTQYPYDDDDNLLYPGTGTFTDDPKSYYILDIPMKSDEQYLNQIKDNAAFYKVKSFNLSEDAIINDAFNDLSIDGGVLSTLYTQEALADDYKSHNGIMPFMVDSDNSVTSLFTYNSRLHVAALKEKLFGGFKALEMVPAIYSCEYTTATVGDHVGFIVYKIWVYLKTEDGEKIVLHSSGGEVQDPFLFETSPLFYPDNRAVKMVIEFKYGFETGQPEHYVEYRMEPCPTMNGAYTTGKLENTNLHPLPEEYDDTHAPYTPPTSQPTNAQSLVPYSNKIYTSDVTNPYRFPASGIVTVGIGTIIGLQSATSALSQGQFGQFPLYILASDGVWALSVSDTGTYTNVHPVSRDICVNKDSVASLNNAVAFASSRGVMLVTGSTVRCITDDIASQYPFDLDLLPGFYALATAAGVSQLTLSQCQILPFQDFLVGCQIVYDYKHQRLVIFNADNYEQSGDIHYKYHYAYVYSLKTGTWGLTGSELLYRLNSYPEAWAVDRSNRIVNFSADESETDHRKAILLTRPLKLGDGDTLKSMRTLVQRGDVQRGDVQTALFASRDLYSWQLVASSVDHFIRNLRGTPYKYFRVAAFTDLNGSKSLYGAEVDVEPRHTSRIV